MSATTSYLARLRGLPPVGAELGPVRQPSTVVSSLEVDEARGALLMRFETQRGRLIGHRYLAPLDRADVRYASC